jgi:anti-sigma factor RsiW
MSCDVHASGSIDLYFYGELEPAEREAADRHMAACRECREALEELTVIRETLASRPVVAAPASGDWSGFMSRLDEAIARDADSSRVDIVVFGRPAAADGQSAAERQSYVPLLMMAALLTLVTIGVVMAARYGSASPAGASRASPLASSRTATPGDTPAGDTGSLSTVSQQHLEKSKLVLLGLANRDAQDAAGSDWMYERELASRLLTDTRLYRLAAEDHGLDTLAGVMRDLELVLLQASMTEAPDPAALTQIQRAIQKRDLLQKMDVVRTTAGI